MVLSGVNIELSMLVFNQDDNVAFGPVYDCDYTCNIRV